mmetsp:Transcript_57763/g.108775  ORF Transcript_57763/g.108775 Transcript_57763/m.108775 type:complete len:209 (-) Transcript_57763:1256-1882(-)
MAEAFTACTAAMGTTTIDGGGGASLFSSAPESKKKKKTKAAKAAAAKAQEKKKQKKPETGNGRNAALDSAASQAVLVSTSGHPCGWKVNQQQQEKRLCLFSRALPRALLTALSPPQEINEDDSPPLAPAPFVLRGPWACEVCTFHNEAALVKCGVCSSAPPASAFLLEDQYAGSTAAAAAAAEAEEEEACTFQRALGASPNSRGTSGA